MYIGFESMDLDLNRKSCGQLTETYSDPDGLGQFVKLYIFDPVTVGLWRNAKHESHGR